MKKQILIIEDNEDNLYLIKFILEKSGYHVLTASDAKNGIRKALDIAPDMILMDIQLPDVNGLEAAKKIRADKKYANIPIVAITSYAMTGDREKAIAAGCTGYIEKPIEPEIFMSEIEKYI